MKKIILFTLASALAVTASAQSWQDALLYSENEYGGTARSIALGNALTAVGGDLGSLGINPAGSAVAGYSQITVSPALSFSVAQATSDNPELAYGDRVSTLYTRMKLPNLGMVAIINTGRRHGIKRVSFGFLYNSTADSIPRARCPARTPSTAGGTWTTSAKATGCPGEIWWPTAAASSVR